MGALFIIYLLPISLIVLPFPRLKRFSLCARSWQAYFDKLIRIATLGNIYFEDNRDDLSKSMPSPKGLYIANHQSFMDIPFLFRTVIIPPIMKKSLIYIPIFGLCAYSSGAILVDRTNNKSRRKTLIQAMRRLVSDLENMMYYPEGSRNKLSNAPKPFSEIKVPIMKYAYEKNVTLYPVSIYGTNKLIMNKQLKLGERVGIIFHPGISPTDFETKEEFLEYSWKQVQNGYDQMEEKFAKL